ncbi:MAG: ThiF family adenylyltransferase, partial [Bacteroidota bacterium]|nr:ThiF family adenylyltransferase [Bacteroidota bacterium]
EAASANIERMNSSTQLHPYPFSLTRQNALDIIQSYDLVIDATDNFSARYLINDACVLLNKPFIYGAVNRFEGQVTVFNLPGQQPRAINYRDLFPVPPSQGEIPSCAETGVLGVLPGMIGCLQANEAIKLITGLGKSLYGRLYTINLLQAHSFEITLKLHPDQPVMGYPDFENSDDDGYCGDIDDIPEMDIATFTQRIGKPDVFVLDVRERHEYPPISFSDAQIPMSELSSAIDALPEKEICIICHQGVRSLYAAQLIRKKRNLAVYSVRGGVTAYLHKTEA